jgi:hypothetical protein
LVVAVVVVVAVVIVVAVVGVRNRVIRSDTSRIRHAVIAGIVDIVDGC